MKNVILFIMLLAGSSLAAQIQNVQNQTLQDLQYYVRTNNPAYAAAEGSRYLQDDFVPAKINGILKTQLVRFNVPDNVVEVKKIDGEIMALSFSEGYIIRLQDGSGKIYETQSVINEDDKKETTFLELKYQDDNFKLYLKENINFTAAKKARSGYEPAKPAKFTKGVNTYYVLGVPSGSKAIIALPKKKKNFYQFFGKHAKTIEKKAKSEKLSLKNGEDITGILKAYFELP
ncbi:MAG: hypothetical protein AB3N14_19660 [Flavobacteriaceae bacterium]